MKNIFLLNTRVSSRSGWLTIVAALIVVSGCSSVKILSDYDETANFSSYQTYQWLAKDDANLIEEGLLGTRIKRAVEAELNLRSMRAVESNPDVFVIFHAGTQEIVTGATIDRWGYGYGRWYRDADISVQSYTEGTIIIDLIDAANNDLVWRGLAQGAVSGNLEKVRENIPDVVAQIMANYPPDQ